MLRLNPRYRSREQVLGICDVGGDGVEESMVGGRERSADELPDAGERQCDLLRAVRVKHDFQTA